LPHIRKGITGDELPGGEIELPGFYDVEAEDRLAESNVVDNLRVPSVYVSLDRHDSPPDLEQ
jgi:hypothetical protein